MIPPGHSRQVTGEKQPPSWASTAVSGATKKYRASLQLCSCFVKVIAEESCQSGEEVGVRAGGPGGHTDRVDMFARLPSTGQTCARRGQSPRKMTGDTRCPCPSASTPAFCLILSPPWEAGNWGAGQTLGCLAERLRRGLCLPYKTHLRQNSAPGSPWVAVSHFVWRMLVGRDGLSQLLEKEILESSVMREERSPRQRPLGLT